MPADLVDEEDPRRLNRPWFGRKDTLWGGETFTAIDTLNGQPLDKPKLGIAYGDKFRVEKRGLSRTLTPHTSNKGTLRDAQSAMAPLDLDRVGDPKNFLRAYQMAATVMLGNPPQRVAKTLYLAERQGGSVVITDHLDGPGHDDGTANVER